MDPIVLGAIASGIAGLITKSNILLLLAGILFFIGFTPIISLPKPVWIIIILLIFFWIISKKK